MVRGGQKSQRNIGLDVMVKNLVVLQFRVGESHFDSGNKGLESVYFWGCVNDMFYGEVATQGPICGRFLARHVVNVVCSMFCEISHFSAQIAAN